MMHNENGLQPRRAYSFHASAVMHPTPTCDIVSLVTSSRKGRTAIAVHSRTVCFSPPSLTLFVSSNRPGTTPAVAMYRNPPAVKGITQAARSAEVPKSPAAELWMAEMRRVDSSVTEAALEPEVVA